jgi:hypothetical protein
MRFTSTWSALTSTSFVISTVTLLALIPAVNANAFDITITKPGAPQKKVLTGGMNPILWYVLTQGGNRAGSHDRSLTAGIAGPSTPTKGRIYPTLAVTLS